MEYIEPKRMSEALIQAEIYRKLVNKGYKCYVEYRAKSKELNKKGKEKIDVFDIIIIQNNNIVLIIETKSAKYNYSGLITIGRKHTKQLTKYLKHNIPIYLCSYWEGITRLVSFIEVNYPL